MSGPTALLGTVKRSPDGRFIAVLWPSPPHPARWMVTDQWGSCGYETDEKVADWPVVGAVPYSPAAGFPLGPVEAEVKTAKAPGLEWKTAGHRAWYASDGVRGWRLECLNDPDEYGRRGWFLFTVSDGQKADRGEWMSRRIDRAKARVELMAAAVERSRPSS